MKVLLFEQHRPFFEQTATVFNRRKTATGRSVLRPVAGNAGPNAY